jgi:hypothetical protein
MLCVLHRRFFIDASLKVMRSIGLGSAALSAAALASFAWTSPPPAVCESPSPPPEAAAEADRAALERRVSAFIRAITRYPGLSDGDSLVRWNTPICLLVAGLNAQDAAFVSNRLSQISSSAGAPLARAPCQQNFIVVATAEPDRVLHAWNARDKRLFGDATPAQVRQFLEGSESRPVRVWYNIDTGRKSGTRNGHFIPSNARAESSAFVGNSVFNFSSIFAIIDTHRTEHTALEQLADYVAMTGLTGVDLDADFGNAPSILDLFTSSAEKPPPGLSRWDLAFLRALYESDQTSRTQRLEITERVIHEISR